MLVHTETESKVLESAGEEQFELENGQVAVRVRGSQSSGR